MDKKCSLVCLFYQLNHIIAKSIKLMKVNPLKMNPISSVFIKKIDFSSKCSDILKYALFRPQVASNNDSQQLIQYHLLPNDQFSIEIMNLKVGIRVRPFNKKEQRQRSNTCVNIHNQTLRIFDPQDGDHQCRFFSFDYGFSSHEHLQIDQKGYRFLNKQKQADQEKIFSTLGVNLINDVWEGYNCTLLAYGLRGAGKKYTMFGDQSNQGIIPRFSAMLFQKINHQRSMNLDIQFEVAMSMIVIQRNKIYDLLDFSQNSFQKSLHIRENRQIGVFIQDLESRIAQQHENFTQLLKGGFEKLSKLEHFNGFTRNCSDILLKIFFKQQRYKGNKIQQKTSVVHFVILYPCNKISKTGQFKFLQPISRSITTFAYVIWCLVRRSQGRNNIVPYRDSQITRILQPYLGNNSRSTLLCMVPPGQQHLQEILSSARFASNARLVVQNAVINQKIIDLEKQSTNMNLKNNFNKLEEKSEKQQQITFSQNWKQELSINHISE